MTVSPFARIEAAEFAPEAGTVLSISPDVIEADGPAARLGELCAIELDDGEPLLAEVVAIDRARVLLSPMEAIRPVPLGARVVACAAGGLVAVGDAFAGRAINAFGEAIDGGRNPCPDAWEPLQGVIPSPLDRASPDEPVTTGIRAIDGLLTLGKGQRVGLLAASGAGKTSLVTQLAFQADVDRTVLCLVGERGREVQGLWRSIERRSDRERFTIVAATSDESAARRARAPALALALAEHWRSRGEHVLLLVDSVTRLAMALREIGLAAGSPPTVRAYTPNIFSALPRLVERCGGLASGGAITAVMTVLSESDEVDDPIVELMKSLLDGHIVLSRSIAEQGQFPAIDIIRSVSRGVESRIESRHGAARRDIVAMLAAYQEGRVMVETGAYRTGTNPLLDRAIASKSAIERFLAQGLEDEVPFEATRAAVTELGSGGR